MNLFHTHVSQEAIQSVSSLLSSGKLNDGEMVARFESELNQKFRFAHCLAVNSGTSALHLSLLASGIGPGDEVIIPAQGFISTGTSVLMAGAKPIFADINYRTGNLDINSVRQKLTPKTKAI